MTIATVAALVVVVAVLVSRSIALELRIGRLEAEIRHRVAVLERLREAGR